MDSMNDFKQLTIFYAMQRLISVLEGKNCFLVMTVLCFSHKNGVIAENKLNHCTGLLEVYL